MSNLVKRKGVYYAEVRVPPDVKSILGKAVFRRSTGCRDKRNAELEAAPWVSEWWKLIKASRANPEEVIERIASLKALNTQQQEDREYAGIEHEYDAAGQRTGGSAGWTDAELAMEDYLWDLQNKLSPSEYQYYESIYTGRRGVPIGLFASAWVEDEYATNTPRTQQEAHTAIKHAAKYFPTINDLTVSNRQKWLKEDSRAKSTVQKELGYVRSYWLWLRNNQHIGQSKRNPFLKDDIKWPKKLKEKQSWLPFDVPEVVALRSAAVDKGDVVLARFIDIALYTGMRLSEVAQVSRDSLEDINGIQCLRVRDDAKTAASSSRLVPLVSTLANRVDFGSITPPDAEDAGQAVGKRFGRLKTSLGHGKLKVFHSIRKTATTIFEQAGVPEGITADIVGHEKATITYGLYSGGTSIEQRKEAMESFEALMLQREAEVST
jgi:integrase